MDEIVSEIVEGYTDYVESIQKKNPKKKKTNYYLLKNLTAVIRLWIKWEKPKKMKTKILIQ